MDLYYKLTAVVVVEQESKQYLLQPLFQAGMTRAPLRRILRKEGCDSLSKADKNGSYHVIHTSTALPAKLASPVKHLKPRLMTSRISE